MRYKPRTPQHGVLTRGYQKPHGHSQALKLGQKLALHSRQLQARVLWELQLGLLNIDLCRRECSPCHPASTPSCSSQSSYYCTMCQLLTMGLLVVSSQTSSVGCARLTALPAAAS